MGTKGLAQPADVRAEPLSDDVLDPWADAIKKLQNSDVKVGWLQCCMHVQNCTETTYSAVQDM